MSFGMGTFILLVGIFTASSAFNFILNINNRRYYQKLIDQYMRAEWHIYNHLRQHIIREKDFSWGQGLPEFMTIGIKADGSLMTDEEWNEIWNKAKKGANHGPNGHYRAFKMARSQKK